MIPACASPRFHTHIPTDEKTPAEIVALILAAVEDNVSFS
jgi:hypothetical protein